MEIFKDKNEITVDFVYHLHNIQPKTDGRKIT